MLIAAGPLEGEGRPSTQLNESFNIMVICNLFALNFKRKRKLIEINRIIIT